MDTRRLPKYFYHCTMTEKLLFTFFLTVIGFGYLMSLTYLYLSHKDYDNKAGLSYEDIVYSYYGNRSGTVMEAAIRGSMEEYLTIKERYEIVAWLKGGQTTEDYDEKIKPIMENNCVSCHNPNSGIKIIDLVTLDDVKKVSKVHTGASIFTLVKSSHIHLFGIGILLFCVGLVFRYALLPGWLKYPLVVLPFIAILSDITAWYITKWDPTYAMVVVFSGALLGVALGIQILISLFQICFLRDPELP